LAKFIHYRESKSPEKPVEEINENSHIIYAPPEMGVSRMTLEDSDGERMILNLNLYGIENSISMHSDVGTIPDNYDKFDQIIKVHCCMCGNLIDPNPSNTCTICLGR
jgi:hypothetical protein